MYSARQMLLEPWLPGWLGCMKGEAAHRRAAAVRRLAGCLGAGGVPNISHPPPTAPLAGLPFSAVPAGQVNIRYVAQLGTLPGRDPGSGGDHASSSSSSDSDGDGGSDSEEEARLERRDTLARGPEARAIGTGGGRCRRGAPGSGGVGPPQPASQLATVCPDPTRRVPSHPLRPRQRADRKTMRAHGVGGLEHSASLRATVERVLSRAERLLGSAT